MTSSTDQPFAAFRRIIYPREPQTRPVRQNQQPSPQASQRQSPSHSTQRTGGESLTSRHARARPQPQTQQRQPQQSPKATQRQLSQSPRWKQFSLSPPGSSPGREASYRERQIRQRLRQAQLDAELKRLEQDRQRRLEEARLLRERRMISREFRGRPGLRRYDFPPPPPHFFEIQEKLRAQERQQNPYRNIHINQL